MQPDLLAEMHLKYFRVILYQLFLCSVVLKGLNYEIDTCRDVAPNGCCVPSSLWGDCLLEPAPVWQVRSYIWDRKTCFTWPVFCSSPVAFPCALCSGTVINQNWLLVHTLRKANELSQKENITLIFPSVFL